MGDYKNQLDNKNLKLIYKIFYSNKDEESKEEIDKNKYNILIFIDRIRINHVISNLLNNSIRFTYTDTIHIILEKNILRIK
jgi:signal transduction histidine kinase